MTTSIYGWDNQGMNIATAQQDIYKILEQKTISAPVERNPFLSIKHKK